MAEKAEKAKVEIVNKEMLVAEVAEETGLTKVDADKAVSALFGSQKGVGIITRANAEGKVVQLIGFGSFKVRHYNARKGRNPQTGEELEIAERNRPVFEAGKRYEEAIPQPGAKKAKKGKK